MFNFGYSLWLVPTKHNINTVHIPHITVATHIDSIPQVSADQDRLYKVNLYKENIVKFPTSIYKDEHVDSYGVYCKIDTLDLPHEPHLTLSYNTPDYKYIKLPNEIYCHLYLVNTFDPDPLNWKLVKKY